MRSATNTIGRAAAPPESPLCAMVFARADLGIDCFPALPFARVADVVVVVETDPVPSPGGIDPDPLSDRVVVVEVTERDPETPAAGGEGPAATLEPCEVGEVAGAVPWVVVAPPDPLPLDPAPPRDVGTGVTPGQAWANAAAGVIEGLVALGPEGPGSW